MSVIYTRDQRKVHYSPPPGYDGTAFSRNDFSQMKESAEKSGASARFTSKNDNAPAETHEEENLIEQFPTEQDEVVKVCDNTTEDNLENNLQENRENSEVGEAADSLTGLVSGLRGRIGKEELIILLVMLLIASEGICAEVLILALVLFYG